MVHEDIRTKAMGLSEAPILREHCFIDSTSPSTLRGVGSRAATSGAPAFMVDSASTAPAHMPPVKGRPPEMNTIGFPRSFVSCQHPMVPLSDQMVLSGNGAIQHRADSV